MHKITLVSGRGKNWEKSLSNFLAFLTPLFSWWCLANLLLVQCSWTKRITHEYVPKSIKWAKFAHPKVPRNFQIWSRSGLSFRRVFAEYDQTFRCFKSWRRKLKKSSQVPHSSWFGQKVEISPFLVQRWKITGLLSAEQQAEHRSLCRWLRLEGR